MQEHEHYRDVCERLIVRASAVQAVADGARKTEVARRCGISRQTLHAWVTRHRIGGMQALCSRPRGRARRRVLTPRQEAHIAGAIRALPPGVVNPRYTRWTKRAIAEYVERKYGVALTAWQVDKHLPRWGFGSHKEVRSAFMNNQARAARTGGAMTSDNAGVL